MSEKLHELSCPGQGWKLPAPSLSPSPHRAPTHQALTIQPLSDWLPLSILTINEACRVKSILYILCHYLVEARFSFHIHHYNSLLIAFTTFNPFLSFFHPLAKLFISKYQSNHESPACHPSLIACFLEALLTSQENGREILHDTSMPTSHKHQLSPHAGFLIVSP